MALRQCPGCGKQMPDWARDTCPACGTNIRKRKNSLVPFMAVGSIAVILIIVIAALFMMPSPSQLSPPTPNPTITPTIPEPPMGNIAVTAVRQAASNIVFTFNGGTASVDIADFTINLNGAVQPTRLGGTTGASISIKSTGTPGSDHVVVVANFKNGSQKVVLDKMV
jgi:hypothetical protein